LTPVDLRKVKEAPFAGVILETQDLKSLIEEVKPLLIGLKRVLPIGYGADLEIELALFKLKIFEVDEIGIVFGFSAIVSLGSCQQQDAIVVFKGG
jgi:hypothetical protein